MENKNKHPSILWDVSYKDHKKEFITKVATKLCNHYGVSELVVPASLLDDKFSRQDLLKEILNLVLAETSFCTRNNKYKEINSGP